MIKIKGLSKIYKTKHVEVNALSGIELNLPSVGMVFLLGKSGSGKTTLLNCVSGLDKPTNGVIEYDGVDINAMSQFEVDSFRNYNVGFVFQDYNLLDEYNVKKNIELVLDLQGEKNSDEITSNVLAIVGLAGYEKRKLKELSGGQRQRVAIARAIAKNSKIICADEPTGNLDSENGEEVFKILKEISKRKLVLIVTHDRDSAHEYGDRVIEIVDGAISSDIIVETIENVDTACVIDDNIVDSVAIGQLNIEDDIEQNAENIENNDSHINSGGESTSAISALPQRGETNTLTRKKKNFSVKQIFQFSLTNMWRRGVRLTASIVLVTISLFSLGLAISLNNYSNVDVLKDMHEDYGLPANINNVELQDSDYEEYYLPDEYKGWNVYNGITNEVMEQLTNELGYNVAPLYSLDKGRVANVAVFEDETFAAMGYDILARNESLGYFAPREYNEIVINKSRADLLLDFNDLPAGDYYALIGGHEYDQYLDKTFVIIGVYDDKEQAIKDEICRQLEPGYRRRYIDEGYSESELQEVIRSMADTVYMHIRDFEQIVSQEFVDINLPAYSSDGMARFSYSEYRKGKEEVVYEVDASMNFASYGTIKSSANKIYLLDGRSPDKPLASDETIISLRFAKILASVMLEKNQEDITDAEAIEYLNNNGYGSTIPSNVVINGKSIMNMKIVGYYDGDKYDLLSDFMEGGLLQKTSLLKTLPLILSDEYMNTSPFTQVMTPISAVVNFDGLEDLDFIDIVCDNGLNIASLYEQDFIGFVSHMESVDMITNDIFKMILIIGIVLSFVTILSYMWAVISDSKRKIGVLRAQGMNIYSIVAVYILEALVLAIISSIVAVITIAIFTNILVVNTGFYFVLSLPMYYFGVAEIFSVLGVGVGIAVVGSIIPIVLNSRKSPIDLMKDKK